MNSFATSLLLAATVSANYCYTDGCNCNGETRACYSVPRQNMRPQAINTCCPVGVQPTVYGINNGRSINITPVTDSLAISWKTKNTDGVINEDEIDVNTKNTSTTVNKDGISVNTKNTNTAVNENGISGNTKNARYSWSKDAEGKPVIVWENKKGSKFGFNEQTSILNWTNANCTKYCNTNGAYPPMGCGQMTSPMSPYATPCAPAATQTASLGVIGGITKTTTTIVNVGQDTADTKLEELEAEKAAEEASEAEKTNPYSQHNIDADNKEWAKVTEQGWILYTERKGYKVCTVDGAITIRQNNCDRMAKRLIMQYTYANNVRNVEDHSKYDYGINGCSITEVYPYSLDYLPIWAEKARFTPNRGGCSNEGCYDANVAHQNMICMYDPSYVGQSYGTVRPIGTQLMNTL